MSQVTPDVVAAQLEKVIPALKPMFEMDSGLFGRISTKPADMVSSRVARIVLMTRAGGTSDGVSLANGDLGSGGAAKYDVATLSPRSSKHALQINYDAVKQTDGKPKSVFNLLKREISQAMKEFRKFFDRQLQTAGTGILATITVEADPVLTLTADPFYAQLLSEGQTIAIFASDQLTLRGTAIIQLIEVELNRITLTAAMPAGTIVGDVITPGFLTTLPPTWYLGLPYHIDAAATGTWLGLNRATEPRIRSNRVNASSNALSPTHPRLLLDKVKQRVGTEYFQKGRYLWHLHPTQKKAWEDLAVMIERIDLGSGNKQVDLLPWTDFRIAGAPVFENIHAARDRIDLIPLDDWGRVESQPINWFEVEGRRVFTPVGASTGTPLASYLMYLIGWLEFYNVNPPASGYIDALAVPTDYTTL